MSAVVGLFIAVPGALSADCAAESTPRVPLSAYAHSSNTDFIEKVTAGKFREFQASSAMAMPAVVRIDGSLAPINAVEDRFLSYDSINGWNNQLLNLLCALDMARLLNRTLVVPPFAWPKRRGDARVSVSRLIDVRSLASLGVRVVCEDEHGSVKGALTPALHAAGRTTSTIPGEGQPHRKSRMPRWDRDAWLRERQADTTGLLRVTCCLFWTWALPEDVALEMYRTVEYHPSLVAAAREAAAPLGLGYASMHVRRGDKASVDRAYSAVFGGKMTPPFFVLLVTEVGESR